MRSTVICVDDDRFLLSTLATQLQEWLGNNYTIEKATDATEALEVLDECESSGVHVSVIISDYIMPGMRGDELLRRIHERDKTIRKIMLTGYTQVEAIVNAINNASLYRFISKPWDKKDMMLTVLEAIKSYEQEKYNKSLLQGFERLYHGYESQLDHIIGAMADAIDMRSGMKPGFSRSVADTAQLIGTKAGLNADALKALKTMAVLCGIGRMILHDKDLAVIRGNEESLYEQATFIALQNEGARRIFSKNPQMDSELLKGICRYLEKYDGTGFAKLKGEDIPIEARIIGIANYYEILVAGGQPRQGALGKMAAMSGSVFDPQLFELFSK